MIPGARRALLKKAIYVRFLYSISAAAATQNNYAPGCTTQISHHPLVFEIRPSVLAVLEFDGVLVRITFTNHGEHVQPHFNLNPDNVYGLGEDMVQSNRWRDFPVSGVSREAIQALGHRLQEYAALISSFDSDSSPGSRYSIAKSEPTERLVELGVPSIPLRMRPKRLTTATSWWGRGGVTNDEQILDYWIGRSRAPRAETYD